MNTSDQTRFHKRKFLWTPFVWGLWKRRHMSKFISCYVSSLLSEDAWLAISSPNFSIQMDIGQPFANAMPVRVMITREEIGQWHVLSLDAIQYNSNCYFWMKHCFLHLKRNSGAKLACLQTPPSLRKNRRRGSCDLPTDQVVLYDFYTKSCHLTVSDTGYSTLF